MTTIDQTEVREHPARFSKKVLATIRQVLMPEVIAVGHLSVLDPFAGVGGVHDLAEQSISTVGVELEPEWAHAHPDTIVGSVLALPPEWRGRFGALVTSPCYGNRMADHHEAKDPCRACKGRGTEGGAHCGCGVGVKHVMDCGRPAPLCRTCKGIGLTERNTYRHKLGRMPSDGSSAVMFWGPKYRAFHEAAWRSVRECLAPGALVVINAKNPLETVKDEMVEHRVVEFHLNVWLLLGATVQEVRRVPTKGLPYGANHDVRTDAELVMALRMPR